MNERDANFVDDSDLAQGPQPVEWKWNEWNVGEGLEEWDGRFNEENNSEEGFGGIYGHNDNEEVSSLNVSIDTTVENGVLVKKRH